MSESLTPQELEALIEEQEYSGLNEEERKSWHYQFKGENGLSLNVIGVKRFTLDELGGDDLAVSDIEGKRLIGRMDFLPKGSIAYVPGRQTEFLNGLSTDFETLTKDIEEDNVNVDFIGGSTNAQMAYFASNMGFENVYIKASGKFVKLDQNTLSKISSLSARGGGVTTEEINALGVPGIESEMDFVTAHFVVFGNFSTVSSKFAELKESGVTKKIAERYNRPKSID